MYTAVLKFVNVTIEYYVKILYAVDFEFDIKHSLASVLS